MIPDLISDLISDPISDPLPDPVSDTVSDLIWILLLDLMWSGMSDIRCNISSEQLQYSLISDQVSDLISIRSDIGSDNLLDIRSYIRSNII